MNEQDLSFLDVEGDPTLEDLLSARKESANEAWQRKAKENERLELYARIQGVEPPPPRGPSLIPTIFDAIDTPHQAVAGVIGNILNIPGYDGEQDLLTSARKGMKENLGTGGILHGVGVYPALDRLAELLEPVKPGAKAALGVGKFGVNFVGDVTTDPVTYATGGANVFAHIGRKALSKTGFEVATNLRTIKRAEKAAEILRANKVMERPLVERLSNLPPASPKKLSFDALTDEVKALVDSDISQELAKSFQSGSALVKQGKKDKILQTTLGKDIPEHELADKLSLDLRANTDLAHKEITLMDQLGLSPEKAILDGSFGPEIRDGFLKGSLGLAPKERLEDLFAKPAIGFRPPWKGFRGEALQDGIYPIATANSATIPGITAASRKAYELLDGKLYAADLKVSSYLRQMEDTLRERGLKEDSPLWSGLSETVRYVNEAGKLVRKTPSLFSRAFLAKDSGLAGETREYGMARHAARLKADAVADDTFAGIPDNILEDMSLMIQGGFTRKAPYTDLGSKKVINPADFDAKAFADARNHAIQLIAAKEGPEMGERVAKGIAQADKIFSDIEQEALSLGILKMSREGYLPGLYKNQKQLMGAGDAIDRFLAKANKAQADSLIPGSSMHKAHATLTTAALEGLNPVLNLKELVRWRQHSHEIAKASLDYFDRYRFNYGYSPEVRDKIKNIMATKANALSGYAARYAKERGLAFDLRDDLQRDIPLEHFMSEAEKIGYARGASQAATTKAPIVMNNGWWITPEQLRVWENDSILNADRLKAEIAHLNLPYTEVLDAPPGAPKLQFTPDFKFDVAFLESLAERRKKLLPGRLGETVTTRAGAEFAPRPIERLVQSLRDELKGSEGSDEISDLVDHYSNLLPKPVADSLNDTLDTAGYLDSLIDKGGPILPQLKSLRGGLMGYLRMHKAATTMPFPGYWFQNAATIPVLALQAIQKIGPALSPLRLIKNSKILEGAEVGRSATGEYITGDMLKREMTQFGIDVKPGSKEEVIDTFSTALHAYDPRRDKAAKEVKNILSRSKDAVFNFSNKIENLGRHWTFTDLRMQGLDPNTAAEQTAKAFTDYTAGKTKFERNFLNNLFFFYSFSRAQTANTLTNLLTNPGVIGTQIHAFDAVADVFKDHGDGPLPPDIDEQVKSLRTYDSLSRYVGKNKEGLPEFLTSIGLPMEQVSKWFNFTTPQNWGSLHQWLETSGDNIRNVFKNQVAAVNPPLAKIFEIATGRNWFFDRPITDESLRKLGDPKVLNSLAKIIPHPYRAVPELAIKDADNFVKTVLKGKNNGDGTYTVSPYGLALLTMLVPGAGRATQTFTYLARQDQEAAQKFARLFTGVRLSPQDVDKSLVYGRNEQLKHFFAVEGLKESKAKIRQRKIGEKLAGETPEEEE